MKRLSGLTLAMALMLTLLCGCQKQTTEPSWQTTLPNTGVTLTVSGGEVTESTTTIYSDSEPQVTREISLLTIPAVPTLSWAGIDAENITIDFAYAWDGCYKEYHTSEPIEKVDYRLVDSAEGTVSYRFDTSYSFTLTVTTEQGQDELILDCRRGI